RPFQGTPLIAPLSGLPCCWYRYTVREQTNTGNQESWQIVDSGESTDTFWLEDQTGRVVVDPDGADIEPKHRDEWSSSNGMRMPILANRAAILASVILKTGGNQRRCTDWRVDPG